MTVDAHPDTRARLLESAANLIAASPGEEVSLRAICEQVGVKMPTLYHHFGSKKGLIEAVINHGFDLYLGEKEAHQSSGDPIQDIREGWDAHVAFGLKNPGFYTLMYGKVRPGYSPTAQSRPSELLRELTTAAMRQGRLVTDPFQAAAHILVANIGVTLRQIVLATEDRALSIAVREGAIAAITGTIPTTNEVPQRAATSSAIHQIIEDIAHNTTVLGADESRLLTTWLLRFKEHESSTS